jgi:rare lipoprotein A
MRRVAGVFPLNISLATWASAVAVAAVLVAGALYVGEKASRYLPDTIAITSWKPPTLARGGDIASEPSQIPNRAKKAAHEKLRGKEKLARLTPAIAEPETQEPGAGDMPTPETGRASWYALQTATASGEVMDEEGLTAAHRTLPLGSHVKVENLDNGRAVVVRINDRGPFAKDRIIDLSKAAAAEIGMIEDGVANVRVSLVESEMTAATRVSPRITR